MDRLPLFTHVLGQTSASIATLAPMVQQPTISPAPIPREPPAVTLPQGPTWEQLRTSTLAVAVAEATKGILFPVPSYKALISAGCDPHSVRALKWLYDRCRNEPQTASWTGVYTFARGLQCLRETAEAILTQQPDALRNPDLVQARIRQATRDRVAADLPTLHEHNIAIGLESDAVFLANAMRFAIVLQGLPGAWNKATRKFRREIEKGVWPPADRQAPGVRTKSPLRRRGPDWRNGQDMDIPTAIALFGLYDIQCGPTIEAPNAQSAINRMTDALCDFADLLSVPKKATGLDGRLRIAFIKGNKSRPATFDIERNRLTIPTASHAPQMGYALAQAIARANGPIYSIIRDIVQPLPTSADQSVRDRLQRYRARITATTAQITEAQKQLAQADADAERDAKHNIRLARVQLEELEKWIAADERLLADSTVVIAASTKRAPLSVGNFVDLVVAKLRERLVAQDRESDFLILPKHRA